MDTWDKYTNDISSNDITDSVSTLFNETAVKFILEPNDDKANELLNKNIKKKTKKKSKKENFKFFICQCGKVYRSKENMLLHYKNIHLKEKPYVCQYCNSGFSHRNGKIYHERKFHTKIFPYRCTICDSSFPTKSSLKYHMKSKHKNYDKETTWSLL